MTWFLGRGDREARPLPPLPRPLPSASEQFRDAFFQQWFEDDAWSHGARIEREVMEEMIEAAGGVEAVRPTLADPDILRWSDPRQRPALVMERAAEIIAADPARWGALPRDMEAFEAEVRRRGQAEHAELASTAEFGDSAVAQFSGMMLGAMTDPVSLAVIPFGGSPARLGRFVLTEAALGAGAEAAILPRAMAQAERFGLPDPDPALRIAVGALGGAVIGGTIGGGVRAVDYLRTRRVAEAEAAGDSAEGLRDAASVDAAEEALRAGRTPESFDELTGGIATAPAPSGAGAAGAQGAGAPAAPVRPDPAVAPLEDTAVQRVMDLIRRVEAPGGYDTPSSFTRVAPPRPLTQMTVDEVLAWQQANRAAGATSTAAGQWQIINPTLRGLVDELQLTGSEVFDQALQDRLAVALMRRRGLDDWRAGRISDAEFGNRLAQEWAGLPVVSGARRGMSHYAGDGINNAHASAEMFEAVLGGGAVPGSLGRTARGVPGAGSAPGASGAGRAIDPEPLPRFDEVSSPAGTRVQVQYRVVDMDGLVPATGRLQYRDTQAAGSGERMQEIARNLDARRLMPGAEADRGTPIIGPDNIVESGNHRIGALRIAAESHPDRYDAYVAAIGREYPIPEGIRRPVLVAQRVTEMDETQRIAWVRENNQAAVARMGSVEQARTDADAIPQRAFDAYVPGARIGGPENAEFMRRFLAELPSGERANFYTRDGRLSIDGERRMRQALFARAFGAEDLQRLLVETGNPQVAALLRMLEDLAPDWAAFRAMAEAGILRPEFDITDPLMQVVRTIANARVAGREGQTVVAAIRDALSQGDMFRAADSDLDAALLAVFYRGDRARRPDASGDILRRYMHEAAELGRADMADLFTANPVRPADILRSAADAQDARAPMPEPAAPPPVRAVPETDIPPSREGAAAPVLARIADQTEAELRAGLEAAPVARSGARAADGADAPPARDGAVAELAEARARFADLDEATFRLDEDGPEFRVRDILDDLDADAALARAVRVCATGGRP